MKLTLILICGVGLLSCMAESYTQSTKMTFDFENVSIKNVFQYIEKNSDFSFMYDNNKVDVNRQVDIKVKDESIDFIVAQLFKDEPVNSQTIGTHIIIFPKNNSHTEVVPYQQKIHITGTVTDASTGDPLPGVYVIIEGSNTGVMTDVKGQYALEVPDDNAILVFKFIGYNTERIALNGQLVYNLQMVPEILNLEEVVVVGYGTQRRSDITGAISSLTQNSFDKQQTLRATDALQGRIAGVQVTNTSGSPFAATKIRVRGANSINGGNDPLYVVNGVVGASMPNAEEIASIEVLKDASATALYGSRGANGVILITTQKGVAGKTQVTFDAYGTFQTPSNYYDIMDAATYAEAYNYTVGSTVYSDAEIEDFRRNGSTDWQRTVLQEAWIQRYRLNISGGNEKARYYITGDYKKQDALIINKNVENYGLSSRMDADLFKNVKMEWFTSVRRYENRNNAALEGGGDAILFNALTYGPTDPIYIDDAHTNYLFIGTQGQSGNNPVLEARERDSYDKGIQTSSNMAFTWEIIKGLSVQYRFNLNYNTNGYYQFNNEQYSLGKGSSASGNKSESTSYFQNLVLNFNRSFKKHSVGLTGVVEGYKYEGNSASYSDQGFENDLLGYWGLGTGTTRTNGIGYGDESLLSYVGRFNYNYSDKYYLTATYRADGSSKFSTGNKWGYFPSASIAWRASEENFIKNLNIFSNLKVRASFGITGNQAVSRYSTIPQLATDTGNGNNPYSPFYDQSTITIGYAPKTVNTELTWESTRQYDFGIDAGIWNERLTATLDLYKKQTYDLLLTETAPYYLGGDMITKNKGEVNNKGIELTVTALLVKTQNLAWEISANAAKNKNEIVNIGEDPIYLCASQGNNDGTLDSKTHILRNGLSMGSLWGWKCLGVWQQSEAEEAAKYAQKPGDWKYYDKNGNSQIDDDDRMVIGNGCPDFTWGLNTTLTYRKFDFNMMLQGIQGSKMLNVVYAAASTRANRAPSITLREGWEKAWKPERETNDFANPQSTTAMMKYNTDRWIQNSSFVRIKNLSVGYTFKKDVLKVGEARVYVSSQNLLTFTKYKGYDPEATSTTGSDIGSGIDSGINPSPRCFTFGAQLKF